MYNPLFKVGDKVKRIADHISYETVIAKNITNKDDIYTVREIFEGTHDKHKKYIIRLVEYPGDQNWWSSEFILAVEETQDNNFVEIMHGKERMLEI